ncbi:MAG: sodium-dependent transporter [Candidatus Cryptobacteroides sp.]|nr:sodium-dependent transporter [Candidatus Cryptobacteroides sp.]
MQRENFSGRFGVLVAMAGSAIGLGNLWRFPYMVGTNGGAAFIFVYILFVFLLSLPILFSEFIVGRRSQTNAFGAIRILAPGSHWKWVGVLSIITPMIIVSYYSVIGGWSIEYFFKSCTFGFTEYVTNEELDNMFNAFISSRWAPLFGHTAFLALTAFVVMGGVKSGIERFGKVMMPILFVVVVLIAVRAMTLPGAVDGIRYLLKPDFSKIDAGVCAAALGQSFYSLSLGCGTMITYASYVKKTENIVSSGVSIAVFDLLFALIACCAIMPAVFAFGLSPQEGPSLVFKTLPFIFSKMPLGGIVAILFFFSLLVAALTSSISMFEVGVAYFVEEKKLSRLLSCVVVFLITWIIGVFCSLSFGPLSSLKILGNTIFDFFDKLSANWLMTLGSLFIVLFVGWKLSPSDIRDELTNGGQIASNNRLFPVILFFIRFIAPAAIAIIFLSNILL